MFKRIKKSILNQSLKTLLFVFIMFVLFFSLSVSFVFKNASNMVYDQVNYVLKPQVVIKSDIVIENNYDFAFSPFARKKIKNSSDFDKLNEEYYSDINTLINSDEVYYGDLSMIVSNSLLKLFGYDENEGIIIQNFYSQLNDESIFMFYQTLKSHIETPNFLFNGMFNRLASLSKANYSDIFYGNKDKLVAGRYFDDEEIENGDYKIILNGYAYYCDGSNIKEINIGDKIKYSLLDNQTNNVLKEYEFEVIGITEDVRRKPNDETCFNLIPEKTFLEIMNECYALTKNNLYNDLLESYLGPYAYFPSIITLKNLDSLESFLSKVEELNNQGRNYTYETTANDYIVIAGQLESLKTSFDTLFIFSLIASLLMLFSLITLDTFNRKKEIGILLALGETKKNIALSIIIEYLIKIFISLSLALLLAHALLPDISNMLIDTNMIVNNNSAFLSTNVTNDNLSLNVNLTILDTIKIIMLVLMIMLPSILSSITYITKSNPKEIMLNE